MYLKSRGVPRSAYPACSAEGPVLHLSGEPPVLQPYRNAEALDKGTIRPPFVELEVLRCIPANDLPPTAPVMTLRKLGRF